MSRLATAKGHHVNTPRLLQTFLAELRRRRVLRVLAAYAVSAWLILQIAEVTFEPLGFPEGALRVLIIVAVAGLPITFVLAWLIEVGPNGFLFDLPLWPVAGERPVAGRRSDLAIALAMLCLLGIGLYTALDMLAGTRDPPAVAAPGPNSIAVLAFDNFDGQAETDYFSSGLAEEILNLLAELPELNVAARTSSFQFRGKRIDVREVAKTLQVEKVLEGSVQRSGDRIQVNAQLIDGATGFQDWRNQYRRDLSDVFEIQREIAAAVVEELEVALSEESQARLRVSPTESLDAYMLYLQGAEKLRGSQDEQAMREAGSLFDRALALDANFSRALAGRCEVALRLYQIGRATSEFEQAEAACTRADELDGGQTADVLVATARLYRYRGLNDRAEQQVQRAIAIAPRHVDAYIELGELRAAQDRPVEAEAALLRAVDLKRNYWRGHDALGSFYYRNKRYSESLQAYEVVCRLAPGMAAGFAGAGAAHWMLGDLENARAAWNRSLELLPSRQAYTNLGLRYYYAGHFDDAVAMQRSALALAPDDHRVWGRLAESLRFSGGHDDESLQSYRRAAELAEANLAINASDWSTRGLLGIYLAYSGREGAGRQAVDQAVAESARNPEALYYQALVRLKSGDTPGTLEALADALAGDPQYRQFLLDDPDFSGLQALPQFIAIVGRETP